MIRTLVSLIYFKKNIVGRVYHINCVVFKRWWSVLVVWSHAFNIPIFETKSIELFEDGIPDSAWLSWKKCGLKVVLVNSDFEDLDDVLSE